MPFKTFLLLLGAVIGAASITIALVWATFGALPGSAFAALLPITIALALAVPRR